ncbi:MAG: hypothetical protein R2799_15380 [Crocinitomicaceae bacterium]|nr:hypothetical protein [Crocinitomicaceae bacterium]
MYNRNEAINKYTNLAINNDWDFSKMRNTIREDLKRLDEEELALIINYVDEKKSRFDALKSDKQIGYASIIAGLGLIGIGVLFSLGTYFDLFGTTGGWVLLYGPIVSGFGILGFGINKKGNYDRFINSNNIILN